MQLFLSRAVRVFKDLFGWKNNLLNNHRPLFHLLHFFYTQGSLPFWGKMDVLSLFRHHLIGSRMFVMMTVCGTNSSSWWLYGTRMVCHCGTMITNGLREVANGIRLISIKIYLHLNVVLSGLTPWFSLVYQAFDSLFVTSHSEHMTCIKCIFSFVSMC